MTRIICFGDLHFKIDNVIQMKQYIYQIDNWIKYNYIPDIFILLGDILHYHERLHTIPLNQFNSMIEILQKYQRPIIILVGNHDMINHKQFLTTNHWMNVLKHIPNVYVIDTSQSFSINSFTFVCVPYVPNGMFLEAISSISQHWKFEENTFIPQENPQHTIELYIAHQEFKGCNMGFISSESGDEWKDTLPRVLSGHIHQKQKLNDNIIYIGSAIQAGSYGGEFGMFSELCIQDVQLAKPTSHVSKQETLYLESYLHLHFYKVAIPQHIVKTYTILQMDKDVLTLLIDLSLQKDICETLKINIKGSIDEFKVFKQSMIYKQLLKYNISISLKPVETQTLIHKEHIEIPMFLKEMEDILKTTEHSSFMLQLFHDCCTYGNKISF